MPGGVSARRLVPEYAPAVSEQSPGLRIPPAGEYEIQSLRPPHVCGLRPLCLQQPAGRKPSFSAGVPQENADHFGHSGWNTADRVHPCKAEIEMTKDG